MHMGSRIGTGIVWALILAFVVVGFVLVQNGSINPPTLFRDKFVLKQIRVNGGTLSVRVARTPEEQKASLNGVASMPKNEGMLFIFKDDSRYSISTSEMLFPVDIIWIGRTGAIVDARANVSPGLRDPVKPLANARYVLLVNAGTMDRYDITTRSSVDISDIQ
ncbi:DUF192 domain-containing protein [Candidatus Kaiserbacteria bacterium]|nr:DUF192 domain-containing protein [Candidatus Kaiserbacteria bacterium]